MSLGRSVMRVPKAVSFLRSWGVRNQKYQRFTFAIRNNAGVLQCGFFSDAVNQTNPPQPELCDRILWATNEWRNLPQVSASVAFGNVGAGIHTGSQYLVFNTRPQTQNNGLLSWVALSYYNGNSTRTTPYIYLDSGINALGSGQFARPTMLICNDLSSGFPLYNTTLIPTSKSIWWDFTLFLE